MVVNDPIADMLTRIRNALIAKHDSVEIPASTMKKAIAQILVDEGYILPLIHLSEPTRRYAISYAVFCLTHNPLS